MPIKQTIDTRQLLGFRIDSKFAPCKQPETSVKLGLKKGDKNMSPKKD